jgi:hypothetical protein|tara:strand:+ start:19 stop:780 length:762 start_codon:yes stop_codon:yes gene_type:complete
MRKYAVVNIVGGLGNQIFTISFGEYLKKHGYEVFIDTSFYTQSHDYPRELELNIKEFGFKEIKLKKNTLFKLTNSLHQELDSLESFKPKFINRFEGYYQDISYLDTDFLKKKLKIPSETQENTLMVHIRRGDYVGLDENLKINYYKKAIEAVSKKVSNLKISIFTDDESFSLDTFSGFDVENLINSPDDSPISLIRRMSLFEHFVIANSTFSLFGAILGQNKESLVYYPDPWMRNSDVSIKNIPLEWVPMSNC